MDRPTWIPAYVGIGSNLDDPARQVRLAIEELGGIPQARNLVASALYGNPPMGPQDQPDYVNAVAGFLTQLTARTLLEHLQQVETSHGRDRRRSMRWGPRELDLDLLVYGPHIINEPELTVPHPGISSRNFVLFPLLEIAPELKVPGLGPVSTLAGDLDPYGLQRLG